MGARRTFDSESSIVEFVDQGSRVPRCASFDILDMTPLSYTPRHFMVPVLLSTNQSLRMTTGDKLPTFGFEPPRLSVFCMIAL